MSDSFDVSARVWPVVVGDVELCRIVAHDGVMMVYYGPRKAVVLSGKLELAEFMRYSSDVQPESEAFESMNTALTGAALFAFGESNTMRLGPKSRPKDDMRDWVETMLGRRVGSIVKSKDLRKAWHDHLCSSMKVGDYWSAYRFHARLREYGYTIERLKGTDGTGSYILDVFIRDGRSPCVRPVKRKRVKRNPATTTPTTPPSAGETP
jgi:hypothetical protein